MTDKNLLRVLLADCSGINAGLTSCESTHFQTIHGWSPAFRSRTFNVPFFSCHPISRVAKFVGVI